MVLAVAQKSKYFSRESDIVLLCLTHEHGYGNWTAIKQAIRRDTRCRFDHLFMSRSEQDLQRRLDILVKALEKEQNDKINGVTKVTKAMSKTNLEPKEGNENQDEAMDSEEEEYYKPEKKSPEKSEEDMRHLDDECEINIGGNDDDANSN